MTTPPVPPPPGQGAPVPPPPQPPTTATGKPKLSHRRWFPWALGFGCFFLGAGMAGAGSSTTSAGPPSAAPTVTVTSTETSTETAPAEEPTAEPASVDLPTAKDFTITPQVKSKKCFGSAGCNVTYRPRLTWVGSGSPPGDDVSYDLTYQVTGGEDGAQIGTLSITGTSYETSDEMVSTASSSAKLRGKVVSIEKT